MSIMYTTRGGAVFSGGGRGLGGKPNRCVNRDCRICKGADFRKIEGEGVTPSVLTHL